LFGSSDSSKALGIKLLGDLPLIPGVSTGSDVGLPYALFFNSHPDTQGAAGQRWLEEMLGITGRVWESLNAEHRLP